MTTLAALALAGCLAVDPDTDRILGADLARALPGLAAPVPDEAVSLAPAPGAQRIFRAAELGRIAARWRQAAPPDGEICFERPLAPLAPAQIAAAMRKELPEARIEVLDFSRWPVPAGKLRFALKDLGRSGETALWNGCVQYGGNQRFRVWARVKVRVTRPRVVAAEDLAAGRRLEGVSLRLETAEESPGGARLPGSLDEVRGRRLRRPVARGAALRFDWLEPDADVARGDTVRVEVRSGAARLELEGLAETSGSAGQTVRVLNPVSGKRFTARVEGRGRVSVRAGA